MFKCEVLTFDLFQNDEFVSGSTGEEERVEGTVGRHVYAEYFSVGAGKFFLFLFLLVILASHVAFLLCEWWISVW